MAPNTKHASSGAAEPKPRAAEPKTVVQTTSKQVTPDYTRPEDENEAPFKDHGYSEAAVDAVSSGKPLFDPDAQPDSRYDADGVAKLTPEAIAGIEAQAKTAVYEERVKLAKEAMLRDAISRERARTCPAERMWQYTVILPLHTVDVKIDGRIYMHGCTYAVAQSEVSTLRHMVQQAWQHDREVFGRRDENAYRKPHDRILSGKGMAANA